MFQVHSSLFLALVALGPLAALAASDFGTAAPGADAACAGGPGRLGDGVYYPLGNEHSHRKSPLLIGKSTISNYFYGHFPIATLNYQRVPVKNLQKSNDGKKILNLTQNSEKKYGFWFF